MILIILGGRADNSYYYRPILTFHTRMYSFVKRKTFLGKINNRTITGYRET